MSDRDSIEDLVAQAAALIGDAYDIAARSENPYALAWLGVVLARANLIRLSEARTALEKATKVAS